MEYVYHLQNITTLGRTMPSSGVQHLLLPSSTCALSASTLSLSSRLLEWRKEAVTGAINSPAAHASVGPGATIWFERKGLLPTAGRAGCVGWARRKAAVLRACATSADAATRTSSGEKMPCKVWKGASQVSELTFMKELPIGCLHNL